jgi:hypothetical protein
MRRSTDAATKGARAAEDSITLTREMSRLDQPAWLAPIAIGGTPKIGKPLTVSVKYNNTGKTFARNVQIASFAHAVLKGQKPNFDRVDNDPESERRIALLPPNGESVFVSPFQKGRAYHRR